MKLFKIIVTGIISILFIIVHSNLFAATTYSDSAHGDTNNGVTGLVSGDGTVYATGNCAHCHDQHAVRETSSHTPFDSLRGISEEGLCETCHDGNPRPNIQTLVNKTYSHPIDDYSGRHTSSLREKDTTTNGTAFRGALRHVECSDCHNPHEIGDTDSLHTKGTNALTDSDPLQGVWGVEPTTDVKWSVVSNANYTEVNPSTKEYQICFKCHSSYGLNDADGITSWTGPSGVTITDQAKEFSKGNLSVHPVRVGLDNQTGANFGEDPNGGNNSIKGLADAQMATGWKSEGTQTMYCSDCHGTENTSTPQGPHGSGNIFMLKGEGGASNNYAFWPREAANGTGNYFTLKRLRDNTNTSQSKLLCKKCHNVYPGGSYTNKSVGGFYNYVHDKHYDKEFANDYGGFSRSTAGDVPCVACHSPIPHGSARSRLIGYITDPAPYTISISGDTFPVISGFKKGSGPGEYDWNNGNEPGYDKENCYINSSICGSHSNQGGSVGGYE